MQLAPAGCSLGRSCVSDMPHVCTCSWTRFQMRLKLPQFSPASPLICKAGHAASWGFQLRPGGWCWKWGSPGAGGKATRVNWVTFLGAQSLWWQASLLSRATARAVVSATPPPLQAVGELWGLRALLCPMKLSREGNLRLIFIFSCSSFPSPSSPRALAPVIQCDFLEKKKKKATWVGCLFLKPFPFLMTFHLGRGERPS